MTNYTQKDIAQILDRAAARAHSVNASPATPKQCWFLAKLMLEDANKFGLQSLEITPTNTSQVLTSKRASCLIDMYLGASKAA